MNSVIIGLGTQGKKRSKILKKKKINFVTVDIKNKIADYKNLKELNLNNFENFYVCVPDSKKEKIIKFLLNNKKNILVEKPLVFKNLKNLKNLKKNKNFKSNILYTAYNHRFEPHIKNVKKILKNKEIGKVYLCKLFYGNGTASLIKKNKWRDKGLGIIQDLLPHLLDISLYWFEKKIKNIKLIKQSKFENKSPDHALLISNNSKIFFQFEITSCMWRNSFHCDIIGEKGSVHIDSLCKWGPSKLILRKRIKPSGKPREREKIIKINDPTWKKEEEYFAELRKKKISNNSRFDRDLWIAEILNKL